MKTKSLVALVFSIVLITSGCTSRWITVALQDLPILTQMSLNLANLVSVLASGQQASPSDAAVIQNISAQASRDLNLLQSLYAEYNANPSPGTLVKIQNVISDLQRNLPALLQSAHIANPILAARVTAAVNLVLSTVNSFAALIPQGSHPASRIAITPYIPSAKDLKKQWNQQVCAPTGNPALDEAFAQSIIR